MAFFSSTYAPRPVELEAVALPAAETAYLPDNVDVTMFFGYHGSKRDFNPLRKLIAAADIYVPEVAAWNMADFSLLSRISQGDKKARKELEVRAGGNFNGFVAAEIKELTGSNVHLTLIDYDREHKKAKKVNTHFDGLDHHIYEAVAPDFRKTLDNIVGLSQRHGSVMDLRDLEAAKKTGPRVEALIKGIPDLSEKPIVNILIQQGQAHSLFYPELAKAALGNPSISLRRVFGNPKPIVFDHFEQLSRAYRHKLPWSAEHKRKLAAYALAEDGLMKGLLDSKFEARDTVNGRLILPPIAHMAVRFSMSEIKELHKTLVKQKRR